LKRFLKKTHKRICDIVKTFAFAIKNISGEAED